VRRGVGNGGDPEGEADLGPEWHAGPDPRGNRHPQVSHGADVERLGGEGDALAAATLGWKLAVGVGGGEERATNSALTDFNSLIETTQAPEPLQSPDQPPKTESAAAIGAHGIASHRDRVPARRDRHVGLEEFLA
jgi:hypothetical protein